MHGYFYVTTKLFYSMGIIWVIIFLHISLYGDPSTDRSLIDFLGFIGNHDFN